MAVVPKSVLDYLEGLNRSKEKKIMNQGFIKPGLQVARGT